jgi:beta-xylosidase
MKKHLVKIACLLLLSSFCENTFSQSRIESTYHNPVLPGDHPDPTIIRVGENYYSAATTSSFAPNYPLYQSRDLINWDRIGSIFPEPPKWTSGAFWAPELYYINGTYYVYYTAKRKGDNISCIGVATTKDLTKGFEDHGILIEWGKEAIDAYVFKDDDGKLYITWKAYGLGPDRPIEILASELSADGLSLKGEHFSLTHHDKGWVGRGDEGECLVKHNGYYYMLYSIGGCCDNRCTYNVRVARAKSLRGEWEQYEEKALLEGGENLICTGHGTLVQTPDNRYFYLYHAYNSKDFEFVGRQGLLDEMLWDEKTGWPYFKHGNTPTSQAETPFKNTVQKRTPVFEDNFSSEKNAKYWQWNMHYAKPEIVRTPNQLILGSNDNESTFLGVMPQTGTYTMETCVTNQSDNLKGLSIYGSHNNLLSIGVGKSEVVLYQMREGNKEIIATAGVPANSPIYLKVECLTGRLFRFYWSTDQKNWNICLDKNGYSQLNATNYAIWGGGLRVGLWVENENGSTGVFSFFRLSNKY